MAEIGKLLRHVIYFCHFCSWAKYSTMRMSVTLLSDYLQTLSSQLVWLPCWRKYLGESIIWEYMLFKPFACQIKYTLIFVILESVCGLLINRNDQQLLDLIFLGSSGHRWWPVYSDLLRFCFSGLASFDML